MIKHLVLINRRLRSMIDLKEEDVAEEVEEEIPRRHSKMRFAFDGLLISDQPLIVGKSFSSYSFSICQRNKKITSNGRKKSKWHTEVVRSLARSFDLRVMFTIDYSLDECCMCVCMHEQVI